VSTQTFRDVEKDRIMGKTRERVEGKEAIHQKSQYMRETKRTKPPDIKNKSEKSSSIGGGDFHETSFRGKGGSRGAERRVEKSGIFKFGRTYKGLVKREKKS